MVTVKAHVYSSDDIILSGKDGNIHRTILIKDVIQYMERNPQYANSKALHSAVVRAVKNT